MNASGQVIGVDRDRPLAAHNMEIR
jgi:hypothetical protein